MHDPWTDRLSEYIDGDLDAATAHELERHLEQCDVCTATLGELRSVVAAAHQLQDEPPATDLWDGIAAALAGGAVVTPIETRRSQRRISMSLPQLAAAAVVLMAVSSSAVWFALRSSGSGAEAMSGTIVHTSAEAAGDARLVAAPVRVFDPAFQQTVTDLERSLQQRRAELDPATIDVLERSIDAIDAAIADARQALESDPGNPHLHRQLDNSMRKKLDVLQRANGIRRAGT